MSCKIFVFKRPGWDLVLSKIVGTSCQTTDVFTLVSLFETILVLELRTEESENRHSLFDYRNDMSISVLGIRLWSVFIKVLLHFVGQTVKN